MAQLTREEMAAVIQGGGSVLYKGQTIWRVQDLPSEADLAQGDPEKEAKATANLQEQIAHLQEQLGQLQQAPPATPPANEPPADPPVAKGKKKADDAGDGSA